MALKLREIDINMDKEMAQEDERMGRKYANLTEQLYQFEEQLKSSRKGGSSAAGSHLGSTNTEDRIIRSIYSNSDDREVSESSIRSARSNVSRKAAIRQETYERYM